MLPALAIAAAFGLLLLTLGLRGRRTDDHPLCRRCRFDLIGLPHPAERCPECGRSLADARAIRIGHRKRRPFSIAAGAALLLLAVAAAAALAWGSATSFNWNTIKPDWLLLSELRRPDAAPVRDELARRLKADLLDPHTISTLIDRTLAAHAADDTRWDDAWSALLTSLAANRHLTDDHLARYARQAVRVHFELTPAARHGGVAGLREVTSHHRAAKGLPVFSSTGLQSVALNGEIIPELSRYGGGASSQIWPNSQHSTTYRVHANAEPGTHHITATARITALRDGHDGPVLAEWTHEETFDLRVVPADTQLVEPLSGPELDEAIRAAIHITNLRIESHREGRPLDDNRRLIGHTLIAADVAIDPLPVPVAAEILLVSGDRAWHLWGVTRESTGRPWRQPIRMELRDFTPGTPVDVVVRSSLESAEMHGFERAWSGEAVLQRDAQIIPPPAR